MPNKCWGKLGFQLEQIFVVLSLVFFTGAFIPLFELQRGVDPGSDEGSILFQGTALLIYLAILFLLLFRLPKVILLLIRSPWILALTLLAVLSVLWSVSPELTFRRSAALVGTTLYAFYLVVRFTPMQLLRLAGIALGIVAATSLAMVLLVPSWGIHQDPHHFGDWRGIFAHKNNLGRNLAIAMITFLALRSMQKTSIGRLWYLGLILLCITMVFFSGSRAGWLTAALLLLAYPILLTLRAKITIVIPIIMAVVVLTGVGASLTLTYMDEVFNALDRSPTLTGRTTLWTYAIESGLDRPLLGSGYRAFWQSAHGDAVWQRIGWRSGGGHNGFLDLWLELGFAGLAIFLLSIMVYVMTALYLFRRTQKRQDAVIIAWLFSLLIYVLFNSFAESSNILAQNQFGWILFLIGSGSLSTMARKAGRMQANQANTEETDEGFSRTQLLPATGR